MIKSSIDAPPKRETGYPCLKQSGDTHAIVLFTKPSSGTLVYKGSSIQSIGYHADSWAEYMFKTIDNEVRLSNSD